MQDNILLTKCAIKTVIEYTDGNGIEIKDTVKTHYVDNKNCYFVCNQPFGFKKPRWRTRAQITLYTPEGVYLSKVIIRGTDITGNNLTIETDIPKKWEYCQHRAGIRKKIGLPIKIDFADDFELETNIIELSVSGFTIYSNHNFTTSQTKFVSRCKIFFPENEVTEFENNILETNISYVRKKNIDNFNIGDFLHSHSFKFIRMNNENSEKLKKYIQNYHEVIYDPYKD